jgi:hypothetical protein
MAYQLTGIDVARVLPAGLVLVALGLAMGLVWWMVEGSRGRRDESLLRALVWAAIVAAAMVFGVRYL